MIYVIHSLAHIDPSQRISPSNSKEVIKVGFTNNWPKRLSSYSTHNNGFDVLYTIKDGTELDEKNLHSYFEKYRVSREWFNCNEEILGFFRDHTTIESIRYEIAKSPGKCKFEYGRPIKKALKSFVFEIVLAISILEDHCLGRDYCTNILSDWSNKNIDRARDSIRKDHQDTMKDIEKTPEYKWSTKFWKGYEKCRRNTSSRLKYICEYGLSDRRFNMVQSIVDLKTEEYLKLGKDILRASGYSTTDIDKVVHDRTINLDDNIYSEFKEGDRLYRPKLKERLQKIYDDHGMRSRKASALDLREWFTLKCGKCKDISGNWVSGIELLKRIK